MTKKMLLFYLFAASSLWSYEGRAQIPPPDNVQCYQGDVGDATLIGYVSFPLPLPSQEVMDKACKDGFADCHLGIIRTCWASPITPG
ncbi:MAG: hypothetical protein JSR85_03070 [Proteobacteria bacterium]|nr:hypothetical protein [Pseudomonadota bacterium]